MGVLTTLFNPTKAVIDEHTERLLRNEIEALKQDNAYYIMQNDRLQKQVEAATRMLDVYIKAGDHHNA